MQASRFPRANVRVVADAVRAAALEHPFNPVREFLAGVAWDGTERLDYWLSDNLGAADWELTRAYSRRFLVAAVARAMRPGCKVDTMLVLEGPQGIGKSSAIRTLFGDAFFSDDMADWGSKDAPILATAAWCIELPKLDALSKSSVERHKAFLSRQSDRVRAHFTQHVLELPRRLSSSDDKQVELPSGSDRRPTFLACQGRYGRPRGIGPQPRSALC